MGPRTKSFGLSAALFAVVVLILCAMPLVAQSVTGYYPVGDPDHHAGHPELGPGIRRDQSEDSVPSTVDASTVDALIEQMSLAADVIFAGQVTAVRRPIGFAGSGQDAAEGIVEIDLHVDQALRGPATGSRYTLREWSGLWAGRSNRYRVGQRLLLFLYAPDAHGLSAPVHGAEGAIPLRGGGIAPGPDDPTNAVAEWLVDLRWLQTQVLRRSPSPPLPVLSPIRTRPGSPRPVGSVISERGSSRTQLESGSLLVPAIREPWLRPTPSPVETQPLSQVLALCHEAIELRKIGTMGAMRQRDGTR